MAKVDWSEVFIRLHPFVAEVQSECWEQIEDALGVFPTSVEHRYTQLMAADLTAVPLLDGGVLFYEDSGWDDDGDRSDALETWFAEGDALGEERDEDDFVWESSDPDPSRLHDGVYVIGSNLIRLLAAEVGCGEERPDLSGDVVSLETLRSEAMLGRTKLADPLQQAKLLADYGMVCDWDGLSKLLSPETDDKHDLRVGPGRDVRSPWRRDVTHRRSSCVEGV